MVPYYRAARKAYYQAKSEENIAKIGILETIKILKNSTKENESKEEIQTEKTRIDHDFYEKVLKGLTKTRRKELATELGKKEKIQNAIKVVESLYPQENPSLEEIKNLEPVEDEKTH